MNTTTILRTSAVALATGLLCWHQAGHAAATESQLRGVVLYGNVSIQEDSTGSWGPWAEFEPTAAGNTPPAAAPRTANDPYRPLAQTAGAPTWAEGSPCTSGGFCGFGAFTDGQVWDPNQSGLQREGQEVMPALHPYFHVAEVLEGPNPEGRSYLPQTIVLTTSLLSETGQFLLPNSGPLELNDGEGTFYRGGDKRNYTQLWPQVWTSFFDPEEVQATLIMNGDLQTYVSGTITQQRQWGVIGYTTTSEQMAMLNSGAQASYQGYDADGGAVSMQVNFGPGNGTWSGTWNGGRDDGVSAGTTASGGTVLQGRVGFTASGNVSGVNFRSDQVGTNDAGATVSGFVQGVFYGPVNVDAPASTRGPAAAGGVANITKTTQSYSNGRFVSPFLAVRSDLFKANNDK